MLSPERRNTYTEGKEMKRGKEKGEKRSKKGRKAASDNNNDDELAVSPENERGFPVSCICDGAVDAHE